MADVTVLDTTSAKIGVNVSPEELKNLPVNGRNFANLMTLATGRDDRRQRRLGERALQRQIEPAELSELRRRRRHLRVGRQPRLSQRHRLTVPPADVDGVHRRVPRQLRPRAGGKRPRRRRQHHGHQQERQQPLHRIALQLLPQRRARLREQIRRHQKQQLEFNQFGGSLGGPDRVEQDVLLRQLRGPQADDRPELHRSGAERRGDSPDPGRRTRRQRRRSERGAHPGRGAAAGRISRAGRSPLRTRCWRWRRSRPRPSRGSTPYRSPCRSPVHQQPVALRPRALQRWRSRHAGSHGHAAPRPRHAAAAERRPQPSVALRDQRDQRAARRLQPAAATTRSPSDLRATTRRRCRSRARSPRSRSTRAARPASRAADCWFAPRATPRPTARPTIRDRFR